MIVQIDVYGKDMAATKSAAIALRNAFELAAYITGYNGQARELDTKLWRVGFTVEFKTIR